jgi:hypothetical protein
MAIDIESGVPTMPQLFRDIECKQNGSQWIPSVDEAGTGFTSAKPKWCSNDSWFDTANCPLPVVQSMIIPSNMVVKFRAKWSDDIASRVQERGSVIVDPGVYNNLNFTPLVWKNNVDGIGSCVNYDPQNLGRINYVNNDITVINDLASLKSFTSKLRQSIVSCGSPFLPSASIFNAKGDRCDQLQKLTPADGNNHYFRRPNYIENANTYSNTHRLTPAQGALSMLLNWSQTRNVVFTPNLNPSQICMSTDTNDYRDLDYYFMNNPPETTPYGYKAGTTVIHGDTETGASPWGGRIWIGDLLISNFWINHHGSSGSTSAYAFDRMCAILRRGEANMTPPPNSGFHHLMFSDQGKTALAECAGFGVPMENPESYLATSPCDCVPDSIYHYVSWVLWNTTNYITVNTEEIDESTYGDGSDMRTDYRPPVIDACNCPRKWRIEGTVSDYAISFKNHNFGWDYEKAMLCSGMWDLSIGDTPIKNYYHGSPLCDDHMKSYCQRNIDDRLTLACSCITQARELQDLFESTTTLSLNCLINSCNDARPNVYKTALQKQLKCTQNVCEQKIDLNGSSISLNGTSSVICNSDTTNQSTILNIKPNESAMTLQKVEVTSTAPSMYQVTKFAIATFIMLGISIMALLVYWYMRRQHKQNLEKLHFQVTRKKKE